MFLSAIKYIKSPLFTMSFLWDTYQLTRMTSENHVITLPASKSEEIHFLAKFGNHTFLSMKRVSDFEICDRLSTDFFFSNLTITVLKWTLWTFSRCLFFCCFEQISDSSPWLICFGFDFDEISMLLSRLNCYPVSRH